MVPNLKLGTLLLLLAGIIVSTPYFGGAEMRGFSAYAACRKVAAATKGYAPWNHEQTIPNIFRSRITFSDGFNHLTCQAIGIGPFWMVRKVTQTLLDCGQDTGNGEIKTCSEDYYGVSP